MPDTLEVFGREYTNVAGFKAKDNNGTTLTYTRGGSGSGALVDVTTTLANGGTAHSISGLDISGDTVNAAHLASGYTAHDNMGNAITGTMHTGSMEPFDTYEFTIQNDGNYQDADGTDSRLFASFTWHQVTLDRIAEYGPISSSDNPFAITNAGYILFSVQPKNKSQIVSDSTYSKNVRKDRVMNIVISGNTPNVSPYPPYWRARWDLKTDGQFSYTGGFTNANDEFGLEPTAFDAAGFKIRGKLSQYGAQMIAAGDYVVKLYDLTGLVMW